ncbi:hypothetical protein P170DRAFT_72241 [Aspergillus steynii IBT 23096]|uniref:Septin-type G domain-containing protein n=1 Tax=Aspergillus steynii IBT 23096 TaxID=1392250 RepID=A0A2I2FR54_9EURO|nr:uncharacterized protein P170DRAFT_72241 [Aspergillus steynii IBT 23096]PLB43118.1 hypothetical protein P170DRAFT_72241 [Aspergillus steynii IBT 23096]
MYGMYGMYGFLRPSTSTSTSTSSVYPFFLDPSAVTVPATPLHDPPASAMRPPVPDLAPPRSRKSPSPDQRWIDPRSAVPATFFLARSHQHPGESPPDELGPAGDSMYGVQSLDETVQHANLAASRWESDHAQTISDPLSPGPDEPSARRKSTITPFDSLHLDHLGPSLPSSNPTSPRPLTPLNLDVPDDPASLPSSPKSISNQSMRHLDEISITDDLSSQAMASGEEDEDLRPPSSSGPDSTSQLIMPSIRMPSRRPFTDHGKTMGRLKVLVAGPPGSGKTSLVKAIVQTCEDIVHVDPFPSPPPSKPSRPNMPQNLPPAVSEIYASTKPYPVWWSDLEDSRVLRRRKSIGDLVLERNICFVDTSANSSTRTGQTDAIIHYMHQQLVRAMTSLHRPNHDFQSMLAGNGGAQVDAILFLISEETLSVDIDCMRKLSEWTNVIPVIPKSDLLVPDQLHALKSAFHSKVQDGAVKPFLFGDAFPGDTDEVNGRLPFATSSAKSSDDDMMDASTLMSPDYVQPLVASELALLTQRLFDRENMAWIRHLAAKKLAQRQSTVPSGPLSFVPGTGGRALPNYTMSRISDYTCHEENLAQVQLARWASDLQQSIQNERERYAAMARGERAVWLTERLGECVVDGSLVPITQTPGFCGLRAPTEKTGALLVRAQSGQNLEYHLTRISPQDPLGLVRWSEGFKQRGWALVQIVGSFGVVGGLALWLAKSWGLPSRSLSDWQID